MLNGHEEFFTETVPIAMIIEAVKEEISHD
jgi:hypothetical protein